MTNTDRYKKYFDNMNCVWIERFTYKGKRGNNSYTGLTIPVFFKDTNYIDEINMCNNSYDFFHQIDKLSESYFEYCEKKIPSLHSEKEEIRDFFKGAIGEFFYIKIFEFVKRLFIKENFNSHKGRLFTFENVAPIMIGDEGVDLTGVVNFDDKHQDCVFQIKFHNPNKLTVIDEKNVCNVVILQGEDEHLIEVDELDNVFICCIGDMKFKLSDGFKNGKRGKHCKFIDKTTLDECINNKYPEFWEYLYSELNKIKNFI